MRIQSSNIQLLSQRAAYESRQTQESLRAWVGPERPDFEGRRLSEGPRLAVSAGVAVISAEALARYVKSAVKDCKELERAVSSSVNLDGVSDPKTHLLKLLVEELTGKKIRLLSVQEVRVEASACRVDARGRSAAPARQGFGVEYDYHEEYTESERTSFSACGVIRTADGKEVRFATGLLMSREFSSEQNVSIRLGDAVKKDPLVLNFDGQAAQLSDTRFAFDIDSDGAADQVPLLRSGSGFLAVDANGDGVVNDGGELFGTKTGDGFGELAVHDGNRNGWIDENDLVYGDLRVWLKDDQGNDLLRTLQESGVGAIYLGSAGTQFEVKNTQNELLGQIRSTGIFVGETGTVGTVQQVDLTVAGSDGGTGAAETVEAVSSGPTSALD